ncbi:hypothetical protein C8A05DRAFT_14076 [Staphylotrichum tortipilum]|uniref:Mitochondrial adapter protein MCP1 transmembrane domain-containing protein n=1 Tax=Staphylotrichum tortipilum TaxID=2831512 RepID=A0AAN6MQ69_9PEZI|nr:hypothetical protein C8A05DRAFT_14076 [Staphylotrichum longicolle]
MDDQRSLRSIASQATLVSLVELDPLPMDSPTAEKDLPPLPPGHDADADTDADATLAGSTHSLKSSGATSTTSALGLSTGGTAGGGHGAIYYLTRIQRYTSYTFTLFSTLHLATTSLIPLAARSVASSESYLLLAREIYQTPLSEPLLVALPVIAHVASGVGLRLLRRSHNLARYYDHDHDHDHTGEGQLTPSARGRTGLFGGWPAVSNISVSGYIFGVALAAHVFVNRALPLAVEGDSANIGLAYVAHGFVRHGAVAWGAYVVLLGAGCGHMAWGWAKWVGLAGRAGWGGQKWVGTGGVDKREGRRRRRRWIGINAAVGVAVGVWAAGGLGVVARGGETLGWVGKLYDGLYERVPGF